ncbi:alpha-galactosidase [Kribbella deserti]|uniref:Alpha-galactosidase n=1 Tax=Kribbella deserti TaxID=1926257 RepID=A0ABV6QU14_9ACTN
MPKVVQLRSAGVSAIFDVTAAAPPRLLHWGADPGELDETALAAIAETADPPVLNSSMDRPRRFGLLPTEAEGWSGSPGIAGHLDGNHTTPRFALTSYDVTAGELLLRLDDAITGLELALRYRLDQYGVLTAGAEVHRPAGEGRFDLAELRILLPLPERAGEILDLTGKWCRERSPQRTPVRDGAHRRAVRRGRTGHDAALLTVVGTPGFGFRSGEVWATHVAWSGDQEYVVERLPEGAGVNRSVLGGGELLRAGEIRLAAGDTYRSPELVFAWSGQGLDGLSERLHAHVRAFAAHPASPRPVVLNTWEAVYFDHDLERLTALAERAAQIGVERFVLDDGWFAGRRGDHAGLGDWWVDADVWPKGLGPLVERVHGLGMQFGLWVEPEMVNLDSDLVREHPSWLLSPEAGVPVPWRNQYVLDVANPEASAYLLERLDALVTEYGIDFLKWDHNRDLHEAVDAGGPGVHRQTSALYALLDELIARHPSLEIESCASGGARVDLGILQRTHRVWASDCNDPVERQSIQRWTGLLLPPELVGGHVGPATAHTTHRSTDLSFRLATALFGHAGLEWDLTACSAEELEVLKAWTGLYRELRELLHGGTTVRADVLDPETLLSGVVAPDRSKAVYSWARLGTSSAAHSGRITLPGLDPSKVYQVRVRTEMGLPHRHEVAAPSWYTEGVTLPGAVLASLGLPFPTLAPAQATVIHLTAV